MSSKHLNILTILELEGTILPLGVMTQPSGIVPWVLVPVPVGSHGHPVCVLVLPLPMPPAGTVGEFD